MVECRAQMIISTTTNPGGMAEWTKAVVLKTTVGETSPGVRIPLPPPSINYYSYILSMISVSVFATQSLASVSLSPP